MLLQKMSKTVLFRENRAVFCVLEEIERENGGILFDLWEKQWYSIKRYANVFAEEMGA